MTWHNSEKLDKLDILIGLAIKDFLDEDTERCMNADVSGITFSANYYRRKRQIINRYIIKQRISDAKKIASKVAIVMLCVLSAAFITVMSISALRNALWDVIVEWYDDYIVVKYEKVENDVDSIHISNTSDNSIEYVPSKIEEFMKPRYMPEGVDEEIVVQSIVMNIIDYYKGDELQYSFKQQLLKKREEIINNNESIINETMINGNPAVFFESKDSEELIIVWDDGRYVYLLSSYLNINESISIAESVG